MSIKIDVSKTVEKFKKYSEAVVSKIDKALVECAVIVETDAKADAPVKYGQLRGSIGYRLSQDGSGKRYAEIYAGAKYAVWVEYGTGIYAAKGDGRKGGWVYKDEATGKFIWTMGNKPQPFMFPALEKNRGRINGIFADAVKAAENA